MSAKIPFATRSSLGISLLKDDEKQEIVQSKVCKNMLFSPDGNYFAAVDGTRLKIFSTNSWNVIREVENTKASFLVFSPKSSYLASWEPYITTKDNPQGKPNLNVYKAATGELIKSFTQKKPTNWEPQWSGDEHLLSKAVNTDVVFYEKHNFERIVARVTGAKISGFSLSPTSGPYYVLCAIPGTSGQPSFGRLFKYPNFESQNCVASKSFFQADKVDFYWNSKGTQALLFTTTEVDKTGGSYYGKQGLHSMAINGETAMVSMSKDGPIYNVAWSPKGHEFCVIYGFVPAKATIFNAKCEPIFEFGTGAWNSIYYNPHGNLLLLGGFGNLRGHIEIREMANKSLIGTCEAADSTVLEWAPDGVHFLTGTTAPRLRIGNGFKVWHYSGVLLQEKSVTNNEELYDITWKKCAQDAFPEPVISKEKVKGISSSQPVASKEAYRPPSARNRPVVKFSLDDEPQKIEPQSKASIKQKKKRDAKKAKKVEGEPEATTRTGFVSLVQINATGNDELDKKLKNIKKKLDAIEKLKEQQAQGKVLEINQIEKIKGEDALLAELKNLQL